MADLPSGTVTFLFTDIEGSTRLWERDRAAMTSATARHDAILSAAIAAHQGSLFKHVGDATQAAFARATDAVAAAMTAQRAIATADWAETGPLRVRMAIHAGEAAPTPTGDYHQISCLNRLARLLDAGWGGQILLSDVVRAAVSELLPPGATLRDLGKHRLRDLLEPERVGQLIVPDLPDAFPPLKSLERHPTNLPIQPNDLIGREPELALLQRLLTDNGARLVTLTGPGGTGKTRLALQLGAELLDRFEDGVFLVDLAPLVDSDLVLPAIAATLGVREGEGQSLREALVAYLADKHLLLVLDNFEHLTGAAPVVADLLATSEGLAVLATSRAPLRLRAEREFPVAPLTSPDPARLPPLDQLAQVDAVAPFVQRAQAARPAFALTDSNARAVAEICARLDGLPLALELAAARTRLLPPAALLERLGRRLEMLTGGTPDAPTRQQTLRGTIGWSHDLLSDQERVLLRRVAIFTGGCTLEAAEAVCGSDETGAVVDGLAALLDQSLLRRAGSDEEPRIGMLETIREYALERLAASGEEDAVRRSHARFFFALTGGEQTSLLKGDALAARNQILETDHDNLRSALEWAIERPDEGIALRMTGNLGTFWYVRGHFSEGRLWLDRALAATSESPPAVSADAHSGAAMLARAQGDQRVAMLHAEAAAASAREAGDPRRTARALYILGVVLQFRGETERAADVLEEALTLAREGDDRAQVGSILNVLGDVTYARGDRERAMALVEEGLALKRAAGDSVGIGVCLNMLGAMAFNQRNFARADACYSEALALFRKMDDRENIAIALLNLGGVGRERGELGPAVALFRDALVAFRDLGDLSGIAYGLEAMAILAAGIGQPTVAARWLGAAEAIRQVIDEPIPVEQRDEYQTFLDTLREQLDEASFVAAREAGGSLSSGAAVAEAIAFCAALAAKVEET